MSESVLAQFSNENRDLIVRLPYRVGMWVSQVDTTGGGDSAAAERAAIETIVTSYGEDYLKSEFVYRVMTQTLAARADWPYWSGQLAGVPDECRRVMAILGARVSPGDLAAYKHNLIDIAVAVAMAFKEGPDPAPPSWLSGIMDFVRAVTGAAPPLPHAISALEQKALTQLAGVLGVPVNEVLAA